MTQGPNSVASSRVLPVGSAALFILSCGFPVAASVLRVDRLARWVGIVDVVVAVALVVLGLVIVSRKPSEFAASVVGAGFRIYRGLANVFLILLVAFFVVGDDIRWSILLPGLAWRAWLLVLVLPSWLSGRQGAPAFQRR